MDFLLFEKTSTVNPVKIKVTGKEKKYCRQAMKYPLIMTPMVIIMYWTMVTMIKFIKCRLPDLSTRTSPIIDKKKIVKPRRNPGKFGFIGSQPAAIMGWAITLKLTP